MSSKNVLSNLGHDERDLELIKLLNEQKTDSAAVLIGAGMLEDDLESLLRSYCLRDIASIKKFVDPLFEVYAPFSTFSAKINVSCTLGLISLEKQRTLDLIRLPTCDRKSKPPGMTLPVNGRFSRAGWSG